MVAPDGTLLALDAQVITNVAVGIGSLMWLSLVANEDPLDYWYRLGSSGEDSETMEVLVDNTTFDYRGRVARREYGLAKFRDTLPPG